MQVAIITAKISETISLLFGMLRRDNGNVHRAAGEIIASKNRGAGGSVCNVLLSGVCEVA